MAFAWRGRAAGIAASSAGPRAPIREAPVPKPTFIPTPKPVVEEKQPRKPFVNYNICYWSCGDKVDKLVDALLSKKDEGTLKRTAICCSFPMRCRYVAHSLTFEGIQAFPLIHKSIPDKEADIKEYIEEKNVPVLCLTYEDLFKVKLPDFELLVMVDMPELTSSFEYCFGFVGEVGVKETIVLYDGDKDGAADAFLEKAFGQNNNSVA